MKKLIVFDLDGTLAESKSAVDPEMSGLLHEVLAIVKVAIISGGDWPQFEKQVVDKLPHDERLTQLSLLPTCGMKFYQYSGDWKKLYEEDFTKNEREKILSSLEKARTQAGYKVAKVWGEAIEDRGSQITFSALGQQARLEEKNKWDPDYAKRKKIKAILDTYIPEFSVRIGGSTSIDITKPGIDKAYGIGKLRDLLHISLNEMIYIGDALFPGGNDYPAEKAGVDSIPVRLMRVKWVALVGGPIGILIMLGVAIGTGKLVGWSTTEGFVIGAAVSVASTMVLARLLSDTGRLTTTYGRVMIAITLVEDLAVICMTVVIPVFGNAQRGGLLIAAWVLGKAVLLLIPLGYLAIRVIPAFSGASREPATRSFCCWLRSPFAWGRLRWPKPSDSPSRWEPFSPVYPSATCPSFTMLTPNWFPCGMLSWRFSSFRSGH